MLDRLFRRTAHGIRPGLDVITRLLDHLNHPEQAYPIIHVAGTNGKGSVCAMIASVLQQAGYHTGLYTSPHLTHFNERIQIDTTPIPDADLATLIQAVEAVADKVADEPGARPATFFECATAMAFLYFRLKQVDWAVIETGLGGRWDATNVGRPTLSVLTRIDIDHAEFLGSDILSIAGEKAGIIKAGAPVVCGDFDDRIQEVIDTAARGAGSTVLHANQSVRIERLSQDGSGQKIRIETDERTCRPFRFPLLGRHQLENCALAVAALEAIQAMGHIELRDEDLCHGLASCDWPARCQVLRTDPVTILDVAHNPNGAAALSRTLKELLKKKPLGMIVGFLSDKDVVGCVREFAHVADRFWAVPISSERGLTAEAVCAAIQGTGTPATATTLSAALVDAREWAKKENGAICIAGSLYLAGEIDARTLGSGSAEGLHGKRRSTAK